MRRLHSLYRHRYSVAGPQHLWHIDGNHKLILYLYSVRSSFLSIAASLFQLLVELLVYLANS